MSLATILLVEDDDDLRNAIAKTLHTQGYDCITAHNGISALQCLKNNSVQLVLTDVQMPQMDGVELLSLIRQQQARLPVLMMSAYGTIEKAVQALKTGANDYLTKPFESKQLLVKLTSLLADTPAFLVDKISDCIIVDPVSQDLYKLAKKVAPTDSSVLIHGESGTGKEVLAHYIHNHSPRHQQPFLALNCAAIPDNMLEAILFGYERGAFTGAHQASAGKFEQANGGTLLLDEISEMPLGLQAKLLRVLQEKEVERIGGKKTIALDVRIIATTNRELKTEISLGRFREDLFYRLNVFPLHAKPLRQRPQDILPLVDFFIKKYQTGSYQKKLSEQAAIQLKNYEWPGNIRQLANIIQRSLILAEGEVIQLNDLQLEQDQLNADKFNEYQDSSLEGIPKNASISQSNFLDNGLRSREYELIKQTLKSQAGSREKTAQVLGISTRTLRYKMAKMRSEGVLSHEY